MEVYHTGDVEKIHRAIGKLQLNDKLKNTQNSEMPLAAEDSHQRKMLWWVLGINFSLFVIEMITGLISRLMGLVADSLDMLADSIVYGLSLLAVGAAISPKKRLPKSVATFRWPLLYWAF